jgi:hypothetical protein
VIAKMNVLFDKEMYENSLDMARAASSSNQEDESVNDKEEDGKSIEMAIKESLASGKVGSLSVDPNFLEFEPLASKYSLLYVT